MKQRIRYGMVGGGEGAFIGAVHRNAAQLDDEYELVCGAFSSDATRSLKSGITLGLPEARCYPDYTTMMQREAELPAGERMQCVVIVTPNDQHYGPAAAALKGGFHVLSDKPATFNMDECRQLASLLNQTGLLYGLTHPYTAYPVIQQARDLVASGALGTVRKIVVEYLQGWLSAPLEQRAPVWRLDPRRSGVSCCMGDIGVHAFNLCEYVSGLNATRLSAELSSIVTGRSLDDDGTVLLHFNNGARGTLLASQICTGEENNLRLRIYGDKASLDWSQMEPNSLWLRHADKPAELFRAGTGYMGDAAKAHTRVPAGHPEGYIEAFANIYRNFAAQIRAHGTGQKLATEAPGIRAALRGMAFIETVVRSDAADNVWLDLPDL
jgi:predicted dehydrogenase